MAESSSHKFGQIIGELLELAIEPYLRRFASKNKLFLDKKGVRASRKGRKLSWVDSKGNIHDLDYVLERGGSKKTVGIPVAFIEVAWRRYTRHSRNKSQEIQAAILPLFEKYKDCSPFIGVVLAGEFTKGALNQLQTSGFSVLHFSYKSVLKAFEKFGIDASYNDKTTEEDFKDKIKNWNELPNKEVVATELLKINRKEVKEFFTALEKCASRTIEEVIILPLHGQESQVASIDEAIIFLEAYSEVEPKTNFVKYEIIIKYNTGDRIEASFRNKNDSLEFLQKFI